MKQFELKERDVLKLTRITEEPLPYGDDTKLKGESYHRYALKGNVFTVNTKYEFEKDRANGEIYSIDIAETTETTDDGKKILWSYEGHTTHQQERKMAKTVGELESLRNMFSNQELSNASVADLKED